MLNELLKSGDTVTITIPKENREWGYNPCADGTKAMVIGFAEIHHGRLDNFGHKPGVYVNNFWAKLRMPDGQEHTMSSCFLKLVADAAEIKRREDARSDRNKRDPYHWRSDGFLRDLPETPFWEGDRVRVRSNLPGTDNLCIIGIEYDRLSDKTDAGTPYPAYRISSQLGGGWHSYATADQITLIERGPVWKFFHDEPVTFANLKDEAAFFQRLGHTDEVRNPANQLYSWTKEEVLGAIHDGLAHGFSMSSGFFGSSSSISALRFHNAELGARIAKATLTGFGL